MRSPDTTLQQLMFSLIQVWQKSGMTQREFCEKKDITYAKFQYWMKRYSEAGYPVEPTSSFLPVHVKAEIPVQAGSLEVVYPDGRRLVFHQEVEPAFLRALLA